MHLYSSIRKLKFSSLSLYMVWQCLQPLALTAVWHCLASTGSPELDTGFQVLSHKCHMERKDHSSLHAGCSLASTVQYAAWCFHCEGKMLTFNWLNLRMPGQHIAVFSILSILRQCVYTLSTTEWCNITLFSMSVWSIWMAHLISHPLFLMCKAIWACAVSLLCAFE